MVDDDKSTSRSGNPLFTFTRCSWVSGACSALDPRDMRRLSNVALGPSFILRCAQQEAAKSAQPWDAPRQQAIVPFGPMPMRLR